MKTREIKFRAWDGEQMYYLEDGYYLSFFDHPGRVKYALYTIADDTLVSKEDRGLVLNKYTGLKDRNGKEIYEVDIVKDNVGRIWFVDYHVTTAQFIFRWNKDNKQFYPFTKFINAQKPLKIIGNIYENPELLK